MDREYLQLWIGLVFTALLVAFLVWAYARDKPLADHQRRILRFLSSLCAGFAGALFVGEALLQMEGDMGTGGKLALQGAGGFALFFVVWFFFFDKSEKPSDSYHFSVPEGWTFQEVTDAIVQDLKNTVTYEGFKEEELRSRLRPGELQTTTAVEALQRLRSLAVGKIRPYDVERRGSTLFLRVRG